MKNKILIMMIALVLLMNNSVFADNLDINGDSVILIDYDTGAVLFEKNAHKLQFPASTTKILTAILALENSTMNETVTVEQEVIALTKGSHIALDIGEKLLMEQMLHGLMIPSANDAALAIGMHISGSIENFVMDMNKKAVDIGAINSNFVNPNGLHDDRHVSTAYDLAMIGRYAMKNPDFRNIVNKTSYDIPPTNKKDEVRYLKNTNKLLWSNESIDVNGSTTPIAYQGAMGIKTGYTPNALNCLVSYAERGNQRLIAVVLRAEGTNVYSDTHTLLNYGFENFNLEKILSYGQFITNVDILDGTQTTVSIIADRDIFYPMNINDESEFTQKITINEELKAPINEGEQLARIEYFLGEEYIGGGHLISTQSIELDPMSIPKNRILSKWYLFVFALLFIMRLICLKINKIKRKRRKVNHKLIKK